MCTCVSGEPVYEACLNRVEKVLYQKVAKASGVTDMDFYAFSFYYDRAVDIGAIGEEILPLCCSPAGGSTSC